MTSDKKTYSLISVSPPADVEEQKSKELKKKSDAISVDSGINYSSISVQHAEPVSGEAVSVSREAENKTVSTSVALEELSSAAKIAEENSSKTSESHGKKTSTDRLDESVDDLIKREIEDQLGEGFNVPFGRMRIIIIAALLLLIIGFGVYFAFVM